MEANLKIRLTIMFQYDAIYYKIVKTEGKIVKVLMGETQLLGLVGFEYLFVLLLFQSITRNVLNVLIVFEYIYLFYKCL